MPPAVVIPVTDIPSKVELAHKLIFHQFRRNDPVIVNIPVDAFKVDDI